MNRQVKHHLFPLDAAATWSHYRQALEVYAYQNIRLHLADGFQEPGEVKAGFGHSRALDLPACSF